jgi:tetratricopeptide (TPR) repeat protein
MLRALILILALACALTVPLLAQDGPQPQPDSKVSVPRKKNPPPRSEQEQKQGSDPSSKDGEFSSSKTYVIDLSPPGGQKVEEQETSDVHEMKPWNPHRAAKNIEVGDYYFKRKNYRAAESRYREALEYKPNDAIASFRLAQVLERTRRADEALEYYHAYLKILPQGEFAEECQKGLARLSGSARKD